jgi:hypothetical protein
MHTKYELENLKGREYLVDQGRDKKLLKLKK